MKNLRDYRCNECGIVVERYLDSETLDVPCECGGIARRIIGMPHVVLEGITGAFPGAHDKWARVREERKRIHDKRNS